MFGAFVAFRQNLSIFSLYGPKIDAKIKQAYFLVVRSSKTYFVKIYSKYDKYLNLYARTAGNLGPFISFCHQVLILLITEDKI
mmetsp:Transcript_9299/g.1387  ORF Transcript_9299/g.1387 Transcript_9299/m.1387 type:complete len:83 (-) Transcript_9299:13-261(-)